MTLKEQIQRLKDIVHKRDARILELESGPKIQVSNDERLTLVEMRRQLLEAREQRDEARRERDSRDADTDKLNQIKKILDDET